MGESIGKLRNSLYPLPEGKYLIGLSGGADSVAMLYLLLPEIRSGRIRAEAVHVNHGIRGEEADGDEAFARKLCAGEGVSFFSVKAELGGKTDEASARAARFTLLRDRMRETRSDGLILAHNADDQAETFLMRLMRGSGPDGLGCMRAVDETAGIRIYRPMLRLRRTEIRDALRCDGIGWREDSTNGDIRYFRNRIRQTLLPVMEDMCPGSTERICSAAGLITRDNELLNEQAEMLYRQSVKGKLLSADTLKTAPDALRGRVLRLWWKQNSGERKEHSLSERKTADLKALLDSEKGKVNLPGGFIAVRGRQFIHLTGGSFSVPSPAKVLGPETRFGEYLLRETPSEGTPGDGKTVQEVPAGFTDGCEIRTRRPGDRIRPFGNSGSRKLQDYLTDRKIDEPFRDRIPLLCRGSEVLLVCGVGAGGIPEWNKDRAVRLTWLGDMPWIE